MLLELFSALLLWWSPPPGLSSTLLGTTLGLLVLIWASTFWLQVPQHLRLSERYDSYAQQLLVQTNWIRTLAWTARGFLLAWALHQQLD
jgi:sugar (pentulose or hexulose) kinase